MFFFCPVFAISLCVSFYMCLVCENGLSPPVKYFTDRSKAVLLLWIFYVFVSCVCYAFVSVCLYVPCGHLLGKGWPFGSRLWCLTVSLSISHRYPGSGVVLDCFNSWSLHPYLLLVKNGYNIKVLQKTVCLVLIPIKVDNFAFFFDGNSAGLTSEPMTFLLKVRKRAKIKIRYNQASQLS